MFEKHEQNTNQITHNNQHKPHSADYFVQSRDFWWNADFLALMAKRWALSEVNTVVDVGSGMGHWGRALEPHLPRDCTLVGVDRESQWVTKATEEAQRHNLYPRFSYVQGDAYQLPFTSNSVDMVTCQTVLMHLQDPLKAILEMKRILKPGGLLAVVEPNNYVQNFIFTSEYVEQSVEDLLRSAAFELYCNRGKQVLGEGSEAIGDRVPSLFGKAELKNISVHLSDKAWPMVPPYSTPQEQMLLKEWTECMEKNISVWDRDATKRYFLAGGGSEEAFEVQWIQIQQNRLKTWKAVEEKRFDAPGGGLVYLVAARK